MHARLINRAVATLQSASSPSFLSRLGRTAASYLPLLRLVVARLSASHFDGDETSAVGTRAEHSYDNERNSAKREMAKEETRRGGPRSVTGRKREKERVEGGRRGLLPRRGNECKCIEIQIIILSRRIVCPIAYAGIQSARGACARKRIKGWE